MTLCKQTPAAGVGPGRGRVPQACSRPAPAAQGFRQAPDTGTGQDGPGLMGRGRRPPRFQEKSIPSTSLVPSGSSWFLSPRFPVIFSVPPLTPPTNSLLCLHPESYSQQIECPRGGGWLTPDPALPCKKPLTYRMVVHDRARGSCWGHRHDARLVREGCPEGVMCRPCRKGEGVLQGREQVCRLQQAHPEGSARRPGARERHGSVQGLRAPQVGPRELGAGGDFPSSRTPAGLEDSSLGSGHRDMP